MSMTVAEAADQWLEAKKEEKRIKAELETAGNVLKAHFEKTGKSTYRNKIGYSHGSQVRLDTDKVKAELGDRLPKFQKTITYRYLTPLT